MLTEKIRSKSDKIPTRKKANILFGRNLGARSHIVSKVWQDKIINSFRQAFIEGWSSSFKVPSRKDGQLFLLHIGRVQGFVDGGLLIFESKKMGNYHEEMHSTVFEEWFGNILNKLDHNFNQSVVVMSKAPYHNCLLKKLLR